jgi:hypothetical protein
MKLDNLKELVKEELNKELEKERKKLANSINRGTIYMIEKHPQTKEILINYLKDKNKKITDLSPEEADELNLKVAEATGKTFPRIGINSPSADPRGFNDKLTTD